jgi:predicted metal-binding protein
MVKENMKKESGKDSRKLESFLKKIKELGVRGAKVIDPKTVETASWVRWKCRFGCGGYSSSLMCPPHAPTPEETRRVLDSYRKAILFESGGHDTKEIAAKMEREIFLSGYYKALGLGAGPCRLCRSCAFDEGCRHPEEARPSLEACGIDVFATVRKHGFKIDVVKTYKDQQHYFGLILID